MKKETAIPFCVVLCVALYAQSSSFAASLSPPTKQNFPRNILSETSTDTASKDAPLTVADASAVESYESALIYLKQGRKFERASVLLKSAVSAQPSNRTYHLALGCALAGRAASLADAASYLDDFAKDQARFKDFLTVWEQAQKDSANPAYGQPRPLPPSLRTKDDNLPFTLIKKEAAAQFAALSAQAIIQWDQALSLAQSPTERGETDYVRGWGLMLLRQFGSRIETVSPLPKVEDIVETFTEATKEVPTSAVYWQSLGDALMGDVLRPHLKADEPNALVAYRRSLALQKRNGLLWYRLFERLQKKAPQEAREALRQASRSNPENAYLLYRLAGVLFEDTPYGLVSKAASAAISAHLPVPTQDDLTNRVLAQTITNQSRASAQEALSSIEQGNQAPQCMVPQYHSPLPKLLQAAWDFQEQWSANSIISVIEDSTPRSALGYARAAARLKDEVEAVRACRAVLGMGYRMMGDLAKGPPENFRDRIAIMSGKFSVMDAYLTLEDVYKQMGNSARTEEVKAEHQAFLKSRKAYDSAAARMTVGGYSSVY